MVYWQRIYRSWSWSTIDLNLTMQIGDGSMSQQNRVGNLG